jgi:hypothetical protein
MPARRVYIANPLVQDHEIANSAIRAHNHSVVGNTPILPAQPMRFLPGLGNSWDGPVNWRPVFFGASREWKNDEEGWETVNYKRTGRKMRRWREVNNPVRKAE